MEEWNRMHPPVYGTDNAAPATKPISLSEVQSHNSVTDAWLIIKGKVYDVTKFQRFHPGGANVLEAYAGSDATEAFTQAHDYVLADVVLRDFLIGHVVSDEEYDRLTAPPPALPPPAPKEPVRRASVTEVMASVQRKISLSAPAGGSGGIPPPSPSTLPRIHQQQQPPNNMRQPDFQSPGGGGSVRSEAQEIARRYMQGRAGGGGPAEDQRRLSAGGGGYSDPNMDTFRRTSLSMGGMGGGGGGSLGMALPGSGGGGGALGMALPGSGSGMDSDASYTRSVASDIARQYAQARAEVEAKRRASIEHAPQPHVAPATTSSRQSSLPPVAQAAPPRQDPEAEEDDEDSFDGDDIRSDAADVGEGPPSPLQPHPQTTTSHFSTPVRPNPSLPSKPAPAQPLPAPTAPTPVFSPPHVPKPPSPAPVTVQHHDTHHPDGPREPETRPKSDSFRRSAGPANSMLNNVLKNATTPKNNASQPSRPSFSSPSQPVAPVPAPAPTTVQPPPASHTPVQAHVTPTQPTHQPTPNHAPTSEIKAPAGFITARIEKRTPMDHDTACFRIRLPSHGAESMVIEPCGHIKIAMVDPKQPAAVTARSYTPIDTGPGWLDVMVKRYSEGIVSKHVHSLSVGDPIFIKGPMRGEFTYSPKKFTKLIFIAGGTGLAPFVSVIGQILTTDLSCKVILVNCNKTEDDLLLGDTHLAKWAREYPRSFTLHNVYSRVAAHLRNHVSRYHLQDYIGPHVPGCHAVICGPPAFNRHCASILNDLQYLGYYTVLEK